jgi:ferredoxin-type protein NapG
VDDTVKTTTNNRTNRRQFLSQGATVACGVALFGLSGCTPDHENDVLLRPPGADTDFLGSCIRCGQCVRACPHNTLKLVGLFKNGGTGSPHYEPRQIPCEMCEDLPCIKACPTGALNPEITDVNKIRMGVAVLIDQESCLNYLGLRCGVCYRSCPAIDKAITLKAQHNRRSGKHTLFLPTIHSDYCTGCGKCEKSCVLPIPAIKVLPRTLAKGELGHHYRLSWEEKEKHGGSLIPEQLDLPDRMPEFTSPSLDEVKP